MPQDFKNHTRWDPTFHFFLAPLMVLTLVFTIKHAWAYPNEMTLWLVLLAFALCVWLVKTRTYALGVQDRVIRLEERLRMERLLPAELAGRVGELGIKQFVALRFASDGELADLTRRALDEKLAPKQIKAAIRSWRPDNTRI